MAITSKEINLSQLTEELGNKALVMTFTDPNEKTITIPEDVELSEKDLEAAILAHIARDDNAIKSSAREAILSRLGLTESELKLLI